MRIIRIGDRVIFRGTYIKGRIVGVGHTMDLFDSAKDHGFPSPTAMSGEIYIVRLHDPFVLTTGDDVVYHKPPSAYPGSLLVCDVACSLDQLELII